MANNPNWVLGKHITALNLYAGSRDASSGVVTWSTTANSLSYLVDYVRVSDDRGLEMLVSLDSAYAHYELGLLDFTITIGEILSKKTSTPTGTVLAGLAQSCQYIKVVFTRGGNTYTFFGTIRHFGEAMDSFVKNTNEMILAPYVADPAVAPLSYA
jgi:hypothetical protein